MGLLLSFTLIAICKITHDIWVEFSNTKVEIHGDLEYSVALRQSKPQSTMAPTFSTLMKKASSLMTPIYMLASGLRFLV